MAAVAEKRTITAMTFCMEVLSSLGLHEIAVGQAERIFISGARKAALGAKDADVIVKPGPAPPVAVPPLSTIATALNEVAHVSRGPDDDTVGRILPGCLNERLERRLDLDALRSQSLVHIEGFLSTGEAALIASFLKDGGASDDRATALRESSGTGRNGAYGAVQLAKAPLLRELKAALEVVLCDQPCKVLGPPSSPVLAARGTLGDKVVVTRYAERGINYAHQDQSTGGYQAYLLLSRPGVDFSGGQMYIVDPAAVTAGSADAIATRQAEWQASGDLVVFAANAKEAADAPKGWLHGFREVRPGSSGPARCQLCVVGLLE